MTGRPTRLLKVVDKRVPTVPVTVTAATTISAAIKP
jgi:hypothetical protein